MNKNTTIVVTGAAGFIGSCLVGWLNENGFGQLILVDDFSRADKLPNLEGKKYLIKVERDQFFEWLDQQKPKVDFFYHIGARTDTTEFDYSIHQRLNVDYSKKAWNYCTLHQIPFIYASSAATYGGGEMGYNDDHELISKLNPLNAYGISKNEFDKWALQQKDHPDYWVGLKFFNVYGPNEYHKGRMASVIFHSYNQIRKTGGVKLFRSHRPEYRDGWQLRDFIYVKDVIQVCYWLLDHHPASGIYNLGTGKARSFEDLAKSVFAGMGLSSQIVYIDMPEDIRDKYQYFTEAKMEKLLAAGYSDEFYSLEDGVTDYVKHYLAKDRYY